MLKVVTLLRKIHPNIILIIDDYQKYYVYGKDAYIISYLLKFNVKKYNNHVYICNNIEYLNYLVSKLNEFQVSYMVLEKRLGYDVEQKQLYQNDNYAKFYVKGKLFYKRKKELEKIRIELKKDIFKNYNKIKRIKELVFSDI